jgi:hypothetical protein
MAKLMIIFLCPIIQIKYDFVYDLEFILFGFYTYKCQSNPNLKIVVFTVFPYLLCARSQTVTNQRCCARMVTIIAMNVDIFMRTVLKFYGLKYKILSVIILMYVALIFITSKIDLMVYSLSCLKKSKPNILSSDIG